MSTKIALDQLGFGPCHHMGELVFPDAKVVHAGRAQGEWWASYSATINRFWRHRKSVDLPPPDPRDPG